MAYPANKQENSYAVI